MYPLDLGDSSLFPLLVVSHAICLGPPCGWISPWVRVGFGSGLLPGAVFAQSLDDVFPGGTLFFGFLWILVSLRLGLRRIEI